MLLIEAEAKKKWCPETRLRVGVNGAANKNLKGTCPDDKDTKCIASGCMMWRWSEGIPYGNGKKVPKKGYCGKGGKP